MRAWVWIRRQRREVVLRVHAENVSAAVAHIRSRRRAALRRRGMWVRVRDDGRVWVMMGGGGMFHAMPTLRGALRAERGRLVLDAVVRESRVEVSRPALSLVTTVLLALGAVPLLAFEGPGNPGVYILVVGAVLMGRLARTLWRMRRGSFDPDADHVVSMVRSVLLPSGPSRKRTRTPRRR